MAESNKTMLADLAVKAVGGGIVAYSASSLLGENSQIYVLGETVSFSKGLSGAVALSIAIADVAHNWIYPYLGLSDKMSDKSAALTGIAIAGLSSAGLFKYSNPSYSLGDLVKPGLYGATSEVVSQWAYEKFLHDWVHGMVGSQ